MDVKMKNIAKIGSTNAGRAGGDAQERVMFIGFNMAGLAGLIICL